METGALAPYEQALRGNTGLGLRDAAGRHTTLEVDRWLAPADAADRTVLDRCRGPVLDVGCGPGRLVHALDANGVRSLGIDIADAAVELTRALGAHALRRSVFDRLPSEGHWRTVLLVDGNVGIGGDPTRLLARVGELLTADGHIVVETHPDHSRYDLLDVRFTVTGNEVGPTFGWAHVGRVGLLACARRVGYVASASWSSGGREFVELVAAARSRNTLIA